MENEKITNESYSKKVSKKIVETVGNSLGNLIWRIYNGDIKDSGDELLKYKGTNYFIIGGSIGTNGYTKVILPLIAQKRIGILAQNNNIPKILTHNFNSSNVGALGACYAFDKKTKMNVKVFANEIFDQNKIPLITLVDIGGTKINVVLAYLDREGDLNYKIFKSYTFITCKYKTPLQFYNQLAHNIKPILDGFNNTIYEIIPIMAVGQPGLIEGPKGIIKDGARDLGTETTAFIGCNPSQLLKDELKTIGCKMDVYICNDGIAQFNGLLLGIKKEDKNLWQELCSINNTKIMYLGLGTGLGSGCGLIHKNGEYLIDSFRGAYKIKATNEFENIIYDKEILKYINIMPLPQKDYEYGEILSGRFFRKYMHLYEYINIKENRPLYFIPYTGITDISSNMDKILINGVNDNTSLLSSIIINEILENEIVPTKAELIVECSEKEIKHNLDQILINYSGEIGNTLRNNIRGKEYIEVVRKVVEANKSGNTIHFIGIGKSHSIGDNLSYKFCNLGIRSNCVTLTGANAENLTNIREGDVVFLISNSGKSWELLNLIPYIKEKGCYTVAITGIVDSPLGRNCDNVICSKVKDVNNDIVRLPEAPTTTTTSALAVGTAIGIVVANYFDYNKDQFFLDHPNLMYNDIVFEGKPADSNFDINIKIKDIFNQLSMSINSLNNEKVHNKVLLLLKKILGSYYNKRTVFVTGSGSSLHVAEKISATMTSIGIDTTVVNPASLPHGDFAHIIKGDLLIIISASGETSSLKYVYDLAAEKEIEIVLITSNENSYIAKKTAPNFIVVPNEIDDMKLTNIPDQKIFQSFLNLAIGDAIAVLLAWLIKTTHQQFASLSHQGGAIEREALTYEKYLNEKLIKNGLSLEDENTNTHFIRILKKHLEIINSNSYKEEDLKCIINNEFMHYNKRIKNEKQDILVFGMGSIGLAYIGRIFSSMKKNVIFVENDKQKIKEFNNINKVSLYYNEKENLSVKIKEIIYIEDITNISTCALNIDTVFVAIGINNIMNLIDIIIFIILRRYAYNIQNPINFIFDENFHLYDDSLNNLYYKIYKKLENPNIKNYFNEFVGLVPAVNEALVPELSNDNQIIKVEEEIAPLYVDKLKWKKNKKDEFPIFNKSINLEENFLPIHMRKLWVHNMAHSLIAYLGNVLGYKTIYQSITDARIEKVVRTAMMDIGRVLYNRWDYSGTSNKTIESYIDWCITRYKNEYLNDTISRVGRNVQRKLRANDRLLGPLNYIWKYDRKISKEILLGIESALKYDMNDYDKLYNYVIQNLIIDTNELINAEKELDNFIKSSN